MAGLIGNIAISAQLELELGLSLATTPPVVSRPSRSVLTYKIVTLLQTDYTIAKLILNVNFNLVER